MKKKAIYRFIKVIFLLGILVLFSVSSTIVYASNYEEAHSYWDMNGNALDSNGNNNGTVSGATLTTGKYGQAYLFDGINDYISGSDSGFATGSGARTVEFWAKPSTGSGKMPFSYGVSSPTHLYAVGMYTSTLLWFVSQYGQAVMGTAAEMNEWVHMTFVYDGATHKIYENGTMTASGPMNTDTTLDEFFIGCDHGGGFFEGIIDDVAFWNRALDDYEISAIYDVGVQTFEFLATGADTLSLDLSTDELSQLAQLYAEGKAELDPEAITIDGTDWYYFADELPGKSYGDVWSDGGYDYFYLGSGVTTDPGLAAGGAVPELPPFAAAHGVMFVFGAAGFWLRKRMHM